MIHDGLGAQEPRRSVVQPLAQNRVSCEVRVGYIKLYSAWRLYKIRCVTYVLTFVFEQDTALFEDP